MAVGGGNGGQVGVTKHGISTLLVEKRGQPLCLWGDAHVCI